MNIVVLAGGTSTERNISIISGTGVCKALRENGHRAILLDLFTGDENADLVNPFPAVYDVDKAASYMSSFNDDISEMEKEPDRCLIGPNVIKLCKKADIVFMALHGSNGEDGRVQAAFDLMKIKYTGSGYLGSALAMSKDLAKIILEQAGVPVPKGKLLQRSEGCKMPVDLEIAYPLVVKPNCGGSSVGVSIVCNDEAYRKAVEEAFALEEEVVVERYIKGREFSVGLIDGKALPIIELSPIEGFYDYKNKYTAGSTIEVCPANLDENQTLQMQKYAEIGYKALNLTSYARIDFLMNESGEMFCLEANTLPGMTPTSLLPQEAMAVGMDFGQLCETLIRQSVEKY